ncbi:unnamed protein product [Leptidea sinapis]|uniref:EGF-like domain-containing protein n=1 Tax=Leptidea sinapis TaxID=189913 RepID=A0A5E4PLJ9_9NEOP|nr:unnamed protein product [Leptidea sinapis]
MRARLPRCACSAGYTGVRCEVNIDDCVSNKCQNNASCLDHLEGYTCKCAPGFMGEYCEKKIPFCTAEFNPCANGGSCVDHGSHYTCSLRRGLRGEVLRGCAPRRPRDFALRPPRLCARRRLCEYLTSLTFSYNDSMVEMEPLRTNPQANVTLVFSTKQQHGVLMYFGDNEHLAVELCLPSTRTLLFAWTMGPLDPSSTKGVRSTCDLRDPCFWEECQRISPKKPSARWCERARGGLQVGLHVPLSPCQNKAPPRKLISNVQASPACRKEATREFVTEGRCRSRRVVRGARCVSARNNAFAWFVPTVLDTPKT